MVKVAIIFGVVILVAGLLYAGGRLMRLIPRHRRWGAMALTLIVYAGLLWTQVAAWPITDLVVMLVSILAASLIGITLSSSSALIAFCITAGIVDFLSFSGGLTAKIIADYEQGHNVLLQYLSISVPISDQLTPIMGIGDLVILGSVYYALLRLGHNDSLAFIFPLTGLLIALTIGLMAGGVYALPFIGGATIVYLLLVRKTVLKKPIDGSV
jgi:hypothetical protein